MTFSTWAALAVLLAIPTLDEHATAEEVQSAKEFFANAVNGAVSNDLDVSITDSKGNRRFEAGEFSRILGSCSRRTTFTNPIFNPDGSLTPGVHYVTMDLDDCEGHEGGVAIFIFKSGHLARFLFNAGSYRIAKKKTQASGPFATLDTYVADVVGASLSRAIVGPDTISVAKLDAAPEKVPATALGKMLTGCVKTSSGYSHRFPDFPKKVVGRYNFECLSPGALDKSVALSVTSDDGSSVAKVEVVLGGPVYRAGPPPTSSRANEKRN